MDMQPCRCIPGDMCAGMPNRFRKAMAGVDWWELASLESKPAIEEAKRAVQAAIDVEFSASHYEACWCQSMEPVIRACG